MSDPLRLSQEEFKESFKLVPRVAISLLIKNPKGEFLLAMRSYGSIKGSWYLPGSFILRNEPIEDCIKRVAKEELGLEVESKNAKLLGVFEMLTEDTRGHSIDLEYEINVLDDSLSNMHPVEEIKFFTKLPEGLFIGHYKSLTSLGYT